jgi:hypothetical protein
MINLKFIDLKNKLLKRIKTNLKQCTKKQHSKLTLRPKFYSVHRFALESKLFKIKIINFKCLKKKN